MDRITNFLNILYAVDPNYAIDEKSLGELRDDRVQLYKHYYLTETSYKWNILLRNQFCQILESAEEKKCRYDKLCDLRQNWQYELNYYEEVKRSDFSNATNYTFLNYLFKVLIPNSLASKSIKCITEKFNYEQKRFYDNYWERHTYDINVDELSDYQKLCIIRDKIFTDYRFPEYEEYDNPNKDIIISYMDQVLENIEEIYSMYSSLLKLSESEVPALTEQMHWIERDLIYVSDFNYLNENGVNLPTEEEIAELIERHAIGCNDFEEFSKKNNQNTSFRKLDTLKEKGSLISDIDEDYQKIFDYFSNRDGITYKPNDLQKRLDEEPFVFAEVSYKLKIVRSTKTKDQHKYCIFVRYDNVRLLYEEEKRMERFNDCR